MRATTRVGTVGRVAPRGVIAVGIVVMAGAGIPLWLSAAAGAIGVPSTDDWVYMRAAEGLFRAGSLDMPGHTASSVGQIVTVQPFLWLSGGDPWAYAAYGLALTLIGIVSTYLLARRFVGTGSAVMVVLLVEAFPGLAREAASFMTDVPAFALSMLALLLGVRWLQGDGGRATLVASIGAGVLAVSIREFAIAAPAAILVVAWARNRVGERVWLAGASALLAVGVACILAIAASIPGREIPVTPDAGRLLFLGPAFTTFAAVLLPAIALGIGRRLATLRPEHVILGAGLVGLVFVMPYGSLVGNHWMENGLGGNALLSGIRAPVIDEPAWTLSTQLASFAGVLLAALGFRWAQRNVVGRGSWSASWSFAIQIARRPEAPLLTFLLAYAAGLAAFASVGSTLDRYLYPMIPAAAILLLRRSAQAARPGRSLAFAHGAFVWLAASAFVIAANSFAYDAARERGGEAAVAAGYDARTVDAGYEWVGYRADSAGNTGSKTHGVMWYDNWFMTSRPCAVLSNSPLDLDGFTLIRVDRSAYLQYLFLGPAQPLYLYGARTDGCPPLPAAAAVIP